MWVWAIVLLGACDVDPVLYPWDGERVICSAVFDDIGKDVNRDRIDERMADAAGARAAAVFHAHQPGQTVSVELIGWMLERAEAHGLGYATFDEFAPGAPARAALTLAFDDEDVAGWFGMRELLAAHGARVTFFVTRWTERTPAELDMLAMLAADGHDLEPHGVSHQNARDYVAAHGIDAYLADEVVPSIRIMADAGYAPTTFAFPFGATEPAISAAVLGHIDRVRTTLSDCPR